MLSPANSEANYQAAVELCEPGTGQWIFQTDQFQTWMSLQNAALWLHAKPGAGKTVMASTVNARLQEQSATEGSVVSYHFFDYKDPKTQSPTKMLETLLAELCRQSPESLNT